MLRKLSAAIAILLRNLGLISGIVLTVWLPANFLLIYIADHTHDMDEFGYIRMHLLVAAFLAPLHLGALIYALSQITAGQPVTYGQSMRTGLRLWPHLLWTKLVAGMIIMLATIALVVPGVVFALRYFLLDYAVVLEGADASQARKRSTELTAGRKWPILGAAVLCILGTIALSVLLDSALHLLGASYTVYGRVAVASAIDVAAAVLTIVGYLYYREAREPGAARSVISSAPVARPVTLAMAGRAAPGVPGYLRCDNPHCTQLNPSGARFCARCGTPF